MRRLVVSCHVTVANYEYLVYWRFYQDGNIECEVRATGIMVTTRSSRAEPPRTGPSSTTQTYAPFHQHFIVARLDLDVDGDDNTVMEVDSAASRSRRTTRTGWTWSPWPPRSAPRPRRPATSTGSHQRSWKVVNPNQTNRHGTNTAYKLVPEASFPALMDPRTPQYLRAPVIGHSALGDQAA